MYVQNSTGLLTDPLEHGYLRASSTRATGSTPSSMRIDTWTRVTLGGEPAGRV